MSFEPAADDEGAVSPSQPARLGAAPVRRIVFMLVPTALGEHYVIDVISGVLLAAGSWWVLMRLVVPRAGALKAARATLAPSPAASPVRA